MPRAPTGICRICGAFGLLTFEHVPPKQAFNSGVVYSADANEVLNAKTFDKLLAPRQKRNQRGAGEYTLCGRCNSFTGNAYVKPYIEWVVQAGKALSQGGRNQFLIYPLAVSKQIIAMMASACGPGLLGNELCLRRFVLNRENTGIPSHIRLFCYFVTPESIATRQTGISVVMDDRLEGLASVFAEISYPPLGLILTLEDHPPPDLRVVEITEWTRFSWAQEASFTLDLPQLQINSPLPGDFRTLDEVEAAFKK